MAQTTKVRLSDRILFRIFKAFNLGLHINRSGVDGYYYYTITKKLKWEK